MFCQMSDNNIFHKVNKFNRNIQSCYEVVLKIYGHICTTYLLSERGGVYVSVSVSTVPLEHFRPNIYR